MFYFIFSDNPLLYRVPLDSNLFYSRLYYICIGNETVLNECKTVLLRSNCSNQGGEQIGISCESKYCKVPFQLMLGKWIFSFAHSTTFEQITLQMNNLLTLFLTGGNTIAGFSVYLSDTPNWKSGTLCYQHDISKPVDNNVNIDCFSTGRYVTIYNSRNGSLHSTLSSFAYINICEVNVTGKCFVDNMICQS